MSKDDEEKKPGTPPASSVDDEKGDFAPPKSLPLIPIAAPPSDTPVLFPPGAPASQSPPNFAVTVGSMPAQAAILQRLDPQALATFLGNANSISSKQLDLQDKQLEREFRAHENERSRVYDLAKDRDARAERRWNKLFFLVVGSSVVVAIFAGVLLATDHFREAMELIGAFVTLGAGFAAGKGHERARVEKESVRTEDTEQKNG